jgi:hypothetical protein
MLSGYLDRELTQQQRQKVDVHCDICEQCRRELAELREMRQRVGNARLSNMNEDMWRENIKDVTVRTSRGIGWLLFVGSLLVLGAIGVYEFVIDSSVSTFMKFLISSMYLGLAALFMSVLRQRLIERKTDKYKDVEI